MSLQHSIFVFIINNVHDPVSMTIGRMDRKLYFKRSWSIKSTLNENFITTAHIFRGPWPLSPTFHQRKRCPLSSVLYKNRTVRYRLTNQANDATPLNWCSSTSHAQFPPRKVVDLIKLRSQGNQAARQPPAICLSACPCLAMLAVEFSMG